MCMCLVHMWTFTKSDYVCIHVYMQATPNLDIHV